MRRFAVCGVGIILVSAAFTRDCHVNYALSPHSKFSVPQFKIDIENTAMNDVQRHDDLEDLGCNPSSNPAFGEIVHTGRRDFLKRSVMATAIYAAGVPILSSFSRGASAQALPNNASGINFRSVTMLPTVDKVVVPESKMGVDGPTVPVESAISLPPLLISIWIFSPLLAELVTSNTV